MTIDKEMLEAIMNDLGLATDDQFVNNIAEIVSAYLENTEENK